MPILGECHGLEHTQLIEVTYQPQDQDCQMVQPGEGCTTAGEGSCTTV